VDAGHKVLSSLDLASEAKAPDSPTTTSKDSCRSECCPTSQVGPGDSPPSARVDAGYGLVLGVDLRMSPEVLGSSSSKHECDVIGPSSAAKVVSGMGSSSEFSPEFVLEVLSCLYSSQGTTQKEVVLTSPAVTPVFSAHPLSCLLWFSKMGFGRRLPCLLHR